MKKFISAFVLFLFNTFIYGQNTNLLQSENKDNINIVAYFCKGDTMKYSYAIGEYEVLKGDTVKYTHYIKDFMIVVTDSTSEGYKMELTPIGFTTYCDSTTRNSKYLMNKIILENTKDNVIRFTTNELGTVLQIDNWKEVRDKYMAAYNTALDTLYSSSSVLDSLMSRKRVESIMSMQMLNEEAVRGNIIELDFLFGLHGSQLEVGFHTLVDSTSSIYPAKTNLLVTYANNEEYGFEGDYSLECTQHIAIPNEDIAPLAGSIMSTLLADDLANKVSQIMKDSMAIYTNGDSLTIDQRENYYIFTNGWLAKMHKVKISGISFHKKVEFQEIAWSYRAWKGYGTQKEEEYKEL